MSTTDTRADFGAWWLQTHTFDGPATIEDVARRAFDAGHQAATEAAKATGTAGELFGYGSSEKKNCLLSKAQYDSCAPKNRTAYDIPLYAHSASVVQGEPDAFMVVQGGDEPVSVHFQRVNAKISANKFGASEIVPLYRAEAARQPAPVAIKTWQERTNWQSDEPASKLIFEAAKAEIAELRAALAATAAPVLSDEQIDHAAIVTRLGDVLKDLGAGGTLRAAKAGVQSVINDINGALQRAESAATRSQP